MRIPACMLVLPVAVMLGACGDDATAPPANEFAGVWDATRIELVSVANAATKVDLITAGGTAVLTLNTNQSFTLVVEVPADDDVAAGGTWSASADVFTMTFNSGLIGAWQFDYTLSGDVLTLSGADAEYDFNDDGEEDAARLNLRFERR